MHSRIFVLRQVWDDVKLPSMENRTCVIEDELYDALSNYCDYVSKQETSLWHDNVQWLCHCDDMFDMHKDNDNNTIITLNIKKANKHLEEVYDALLQKVSKLSFTEFKDHWSSDVYYIRQLLRDTSGFWIVTIDDNGHWTVDNVDDFCRIYIRDAEINSKDIYSFRLEDVFDYHF
jgi:hypothetical protein